MHTSWEAISAISSMLGIALIALAAWIALGQLKESAAVRRLQSTLGFIEQLQSSPLRNTRRFLGRHQAEIKEILENEDWIDELNSFLHDRGRADGGPTSLSELRGSLATLEFIAVLSLSNNMPGHVERAYLAPTVIGYWPTVEPIAQAIRQNSGDPVYLQHLESLVRIAIDGSLYGRHVKRVKRRELRRLSVQAQISVSRRQQFTTENAIKSAT